MSSLAEAVWSTIVPNIDSESRAQLEDIFSQGYAFSVDGDDHAPAQSVITNRNYWEGWGQEMLEVFMLGWQTGVLERGERVGLFDVVKPKKDILITTQERLLRQKGLLYIGLTVLLGDLDGTDLDGEAVERMRKGAGEFGI